MVDTARDTIALIAGLCVGSFLNVVRYRLPRDIGIVKGRSRCPSCGVAIRWFDNIPVLSYILLRGRCRNCNWRIPLIYPVLEIITAIGFLLVWRFFALREAIAYSVLLSLLVASAGIDFELGIIPDRITLPGIVAGLVFSFTLLNSRFSGPPLLRSLIGALVGGGLLLGIALLYKLIRGVEGMGMGDVKMMAMIGSFLGQKLALVTIFIAALGGAIAGLLLVLVRKRGFRQSLPFGVFLAPAAILALFVGGKVVDLYLTWLGLAK